MSEIAGKLSIQEGARCLEKHQQGRGVLLGGVPGVTPVQRVPEKRVRTACVRQISATQLFRPFGCLSRPIAARRAVRRLLVIPIDMVNTSLTPTTTEADMT